MKYALNIAENGRILSATFEKYAPSNAVIVDELPDGDITNYMYVDGKFICDETNSVNSEEINRKIAIAKKKLSDTDYNILKIVEGAATLSEMRDIISKRAEWRREINELEKELG